MELVQKIWQELWAKNPSEQVNVISKYLHAEREAHRVEVEKLNNRIDTITNDNSITHERFRDAVTVNEQLRSENTRLRESLTHYSNPDNWAMILDNNGEGWIAKVKPGTKEAEEVPWLPAHQALTPPTETKG